MGSVPTDSRSQPSVAGADDSVQLAPLAPDTTGPFGRPPPCDSPEFLPSVTSLDLLPITPLKPQPIKGKGKAENAKGKAAPRNPAPARFGKTTAFANSASALLAATKAQLAQERDSLNSAEGDDQQRQGSEIDDPLGDMEGDSNESAEDKRLKRMRRNRESAAMSRNRKKQYVEELETQVASLHEAVRNLQSENMELRRACAHARNGLSTSPPPLPMPSPPLAPISSTLALRPPLPDTLTLLDDIGDMSGQPSPVPGQQQKRPGSPLMGGGAKRASAASLALMSAVTFVTLSMAGRTNSADSLVQMSSHGHSPASRMLMSVNDAASFSLPSKLSELLGRAGGASVEAHADMLWPSLEMDDELPPSYKNAAIDALPLPGSVEDKKTVPRGFGERVVRAPQNSSWADVLRIEEAEKQLAEAQLTLRTLGRPVPGDAGHATALAAPRAAPRREPLYEHGDWAHDDLDTDAYDAQRYIFCSRTYMFDAAVRMPTPASHGVPPSAAGGPSTELELPASMPARFRHAADYRARNELAQVTDGSNVSAPGPSDPSLRQPVVTLLLPSAALHGVRGVESHGPAASAGRAGNNELMQVQCQVLNASRFTPAH